MAQERTRGMTTVGYMNIGVGAIFALIGLLAFIGGGFMPYSSAQDKGTPRDFIMLIGVATLAVNLMLVASGIGVLKLASWGRSLSLAFGAMGVVVYASWIIGTGFDLFYTAAFVYCLVLFGLFFRPEWKSAFEPTRQPARVARATAFGQTREAA